MDTIVDTHRCVIIHRQSFFFLKWPPEVSFMVSSRKPVELPFYYSSLHFTPMYLYLPRLRPTQ